MSSLVGPDAPVATRPYDARDRELLEGLRERFARIAAIDGTETLDTEQAHARRGLVAETRSLLGELQLGGIDPAYLEGRCAELATAFPDLAHAVATIRERFAQVFRAREAHTRAEAARAQLAEHAVRIAREIRTVSPWITERLIVGNGAAAATDVATLGDLPRASGALDPRAVLVIAREDPLAEIGPDRFGTQHAAELDPQHPLFEGSGAGALRGAVEDLGELVRAGELRDAIDLARERLGLAAVAAALRWFEIVDDPEHPIRATIVHADGVEQVVRAATCDLAIGSRARDMYVANLLGVVPLAPQPERATGERAPALVGADGRIRVLGAAALDGGFGDSATRRSYATELARRWWPLQRSGDVGFSATGVVVAMANHPAAADEEEPRSQLTVSEVVKAHVAVGGELIGRARSVDEMKFVASLMPCPYCLAIANVEQQVVGAGDRWSVACRCARCSHVRTLMFTTEGDPRAAPLGELGGNEPSTILSPVQLLGELDRMTPLIREHAESLPADERRMNFAAIEGSLVCLVELAKFLVAETDAIPVREGDAIERRDRAARGERYTGAWIRSQHEHLRSLVRESGN